MLRNLGRQYQAIKSPWTDYTVYSFPNASHIAASDRQPLMDAMNGIIAVNWKATEPHWTAASSPFDSKYSLILVYDGSGLIAFSVYRVLRDLRRTCDLSQRHRGASRPSGPRPLRVLHLGSAEIARRAAEKGEGCVLYGWRTRNPIVWAANAKICEKVTPSLLGDAQDPALQAACVEMCSSLYPGKPLEVPGMIMRGAYGHIKHHRQDLSRHSVAGRRRDVPHDPGFCGCAVLGRLREGMMSMVGATSRHSPGTVSRFGDRAYLAWATVATAYAIAFLQRVSPQSVSLNFMHDFGTDAAGVAMLASQLLLGLHA